LWSYSAADETGALIRPYRCVLDRLDNRWFLSKILFPEIRIGWLVAPQPVVDHLARPKQHADRHSNTLRSGL
jgi:hypothetical protein